MLNNSIVHKSSDIVATGIKQKTHSKDTIYLDPIQAAAEFDGESRLAGGFSVPEHLDARVAKFILNAKVLIRNREYNLALRLLRQASNLDSRNPEVLDLLGFCLEEKANYEESLIVRKAATEVDYCFSTLFKYGTVVYKLGRDEEALDIYYEALAVLMHENEHLFEVYKNMGNIFVRRGDFDGAEEYYNKAYTLNALSDVLLVNLGTLEVQRSDFDKALYCFRKAVELNKKNDKAWIGLAMVHNEFGDTEIAWGNLEAALDINPLNRTGVHLFANWATRDREFGKAGEVLKVYLSGVEHDEDLSLVLINLFCTEGKYQEALLEMERVLSWNPGHQEVKHLQKQVLALCGGK